MTSASIEVVGAREIRAALRRAEIEGVPAGLRAASKAGSNVVVQRALPNVPVGKTGRLKASIRALGSQTSASVKAGNASVKYAAAIHWGRKVGNVGRPQGNHKGPNVITGRPFLSDAAQAAREQVIDEYRKAMIVVCERVF